MSTVDKILGLSLPKWKGKHEIDWCELCDCAIIIKECCKNCSCNGSGCDKCNSDKTVEEFENCKIRIENYLTAAEQRAYAKAKLIKKLILRSLERGEKEIDFYQVLNSEESSRNDRELLL